MQLLDLQQFCFLVKLTWNIGDNKNLFLKLETKMGFYRVVLRKHKKFAKTAPILVELQQWTDDEKTDSRKEIFCLKQAKYNSRRKVCVLFKTDTDRLNFVGCRYRNNLYLKGNENDLK